MGTLSTRYIPLLSLFYLTRVFSFSLRSHNGEQPASKRTGRIPLPESDHFSTAHKIRNPKFPRHARYSPFHVSFTPSLFGAENEDVMIGRRGPFCGFPARGEEREESCGAAETRRAPGLWHGRVRSLSRLSTPEWSGQGGGWEFCLCRFALLRKAPRDGLTLR